MFNEDLQASYPTSKSQQAAIAMAFIGQSTSDIRKKLQQIDRLQDYTLQNLGRQRKEKTGGIIDRKFGLRQIGSLGNRRSTNEDGQTP